MRQLITVIVAWATLTAGVSVEPAGTAGRPPVPGVEHGSRIIRDPNGIVRIEAGNRRDLYFLQGYVHAQDRFFQMDLSRKQAGGTLAELVGPSALSSDVELRTVGIRRAAERSLVVLSSRARAALDAYADGVNAYLASNPLPPEYAALELTRTDPWTTLDSVAVSKLIAFGRSFDLMDIELTVTFGAYQQAGAAAGFDGQKLFFEDLFRSAPFDPAVTIPDSERRVRVPKGRSPHLSGGRRGAGAVLNDAGAGLGRQYLARVRQLPLVRRYFGHDRPASSNEWAISGRLTTSGFPIVANDPHLALDTPSIFYPISLHAGSIDVAGNSFAGSPFVIVGQNRRIAWGATTNPMDVTDVFQEQIVVDPASPSRLSSVHDGSNEPLVPVPQQFRANQIGDGAADSIAVVPPGGAIPAVTLVMPRRNNGPIIQLDAAAGTALSVQFTGFAPTRELDAFMRINEADGLDDFIRGLQSFDVGSQNFAYADIDGNIAYFTSGEMPVREDLQAGLVNGAPPFFIRNGVSGNEWIPLDNPPANQANRYEILPFEEMPQTVNPRAGFLVNANNDPTGATLDNDPLNQERPGGGIFYLSPGYEGLRAGRATELIRQKLERGRLSVKDMEQMQADTVMIDASVFVPHILNAFTRARRAGVDPRLAALGAEAGIAEAVQRMARWDFSTPTGIAEGYDAADDDGVLGPPRRNEVAASVAATLYSVWRAQFIRNTIDAPLVALGLRDYLTRDFLAASALRHLLETFPENRGIGGSGLNFFSVPDLPPTDENARDRRDIVILASLSGALERLAGPAFAAAFNGSTNQEDYRWGKLHRIVLRHPLDGPFSIPPAGGAFPGLAPELPGIATDGGFQTLDRGDHDVRAETANGFMYIAGASERSVHVGSPRGMRGVSSLAGGPSGVPGSPFYFSLLPAWLTNESYPLADTRRGY